MPPSARDVVRALELRTIWLVGDSVLRQLIQAFMCRLRDYHLSGRNDEAFIWNDVTQRKVPSLDYKGMCPFGKGARGNLN